MKEVKKIRCTEVKVKAPKFQYVRPETRLEVIDLLSRYGDDAKILAGGQSLLPTLNMRLSQPDLIIDINRLEELKGIDIEGDFLRIGALTPHVEVLESALVTEKLPLVAQAMPYVAHVAVRNRGTFGGSIALADPAAEMPACLLALQGVCVVEGPSGRRRIAADDFFTDLYETSRRIDELLVEVLLPIARDNQVFAFLELSRRKGDYAIAGVACKAEVEDEAIQAPRLVYFGSELKPTLAKNAMAVLDGRHWSEELIEDVLAELDKDLEPVENFNGSAAMKLHLQKVLTKRIMNSTFNKKVAA